jgi:membrane protein YqaA with SNARE-associated domain
VKAAVSKTKIDCLRIFVLERVTFARLFFSCFFSANLLGGNPEIALRL